MHTLTHALSLLVAVVVLGCGKRPASPPNNLLMVTIDTLRADHLGHYGYERDTSPLLDRFASESVVFEQARSVASWTLPSVVSTMTGLYPSAHTCQADNSALATGYVTLAEHLKDAGFHTMAATSHVYLSRRFGLAQGFQDFDEELVMENREQSHHQISSPRITEKGLAWLEACAERPERPWFLWLHYFDPHGVYQDHPQAVETFGSQPRDKYDAEIAFTDLHLGRLLERGRMLGLLDRTVVVVLADHGEEFGDHGGGGHRATLYEEVLRVPLMIRAPGFAPGRVKASVSCIDIAPTVYELLDVSPPAVLQGRSLVPLLDGESSWERDEVLAEMRNPNQKDWDALVDGRWKLLIDVKNDRRLLFDLEADPREKNDLASERPEIVERMEARLRELVQESRSLSRSFAGNETFVLTEEEQGQLKALGYLTGD